MTLAPGAQIIGGDKGKAHVKPAGYLGTDLFQAYREACKRAGATYDSERRVSLVPLARLPILKSALEANGLTPYMDPSLGFTLDKQQSEQKDLLADARGRLDELKARLAVDGRGIFPYQEVGAQYLSCRDRALLTDDPGLGKTLQAIMALGNSMRCVWICPRTLKLNVRKEVKIWRDGIKVTILSGLKSFRWPEDGEIVVLNYDILPGELEKDARKKWRYQRGTIPAVTPGAPLYLVADECHVINHSTAQRTIRFRALTKIVRAAGGFTWGMTGTELLGKPPELWNLYEAFDLAKDAFGDYPNFLRLMNAEKQSVSKTRKAIVWGEAQPEVVKRIRAVSLKRMKKDVLKDLPPKRYSSIPVEIDAQTKLLCDRVIEFLNKRGINIEEVTQTVFMTQFGGVGFELISKAMTALASAKMSPAVEFIEQYEEAGTPLVVFSAHRAPIDFLADRPGWAVITGSTPVHEHDIHIPWNCSCRQAIVDRFQRGELKGVAGTIQAMGVGVTLTRAADVLRIDRDWTPAINTQADDRVHRIGQTESVLITDLIADHALDKRLSVILLEKSELIESTTEAAAIQDGEEVQLLPNSEPIDMGEILLKSDIDSVAHDDQVWRTMPGGGKVQLPADGLSRRANQSALEGWASAGLEALSGLDLDHARQLNGVGFSKFDGEFGHKLATRCKAEGLTDREWEVAIRLCRKYRRQLPAEP